MVHVSSVHGESELGSCCETNSDKKTSLEKRSIRSDLFPILTIIILYAAGCGSERLFQSMQVG
jgi:hypothetical protein